MVTAIYLVAEPNCPLLCCSMQGSLRVCFEACWLFLAAAVPCCGNASISLLVHPLALHQARVWVATGSSPGRPVLASVVACKGRCGYALRHVGFS